MTQDAQYTLRMPSEQIARWKEVHRATYPTHGLSFNIWMLALIESGIKETK